MLRLARPLTPRLRPRTRCFTSSTPKQSWTQWWLAEKPLPPRYTLPWVAEMGLITTVFAITGTSTMIIVRPAVSNLCQLEGSFKEGPWAYRIGSIVVMFPCYPILLTIVGTLAGRHVYFKRFSVKMLSRFGIPPKQLDHTFDPTKQYRKW